MGYGGMEDPSIARRVGYEAEGCKLGNISPPNFFLFADDHVGN